MSPEDFATAFRIAALTKALRDSARESAVEIGGDPTEGAVALMAATCFENARMAHEAAAEIAGNGESAVDEAAIERDAKVVMGRMIEASAVYFRERFGEGADVFDETLTLAKRARANAESRK